MRTWEFLQEVILNHSPGSMEIYIMDSNGDNLTRLTDHDGYDGGPFLIHPEIIYAGGASLQTDIKRNLSHVSRWEK